MDISSAVTTAANAVINAGKRAGVVAVEGENGQLYCGKCGEPLSLTLDFANTPLAEMLGKTRQVPRNCACMRRLHEEEQAAEEARKRAERIEQAKRYCLRESEYRERTFARDDGRTPKIRRMCEKYVQNHFQVINGNYGIAFIGSNRCGKTFWASCIANALIEAGASVYMVKLKTLIDDMTADYGENREDILHKVRTVDFLILDDYGAERGSDFTQEQTFEIIDTRSTANKPLIITSNLTEDALRNPPNINYKRSYTRILEMCPAIVNVEGSRHEEIAAQKRKELAELLRGD